MNLESDSRTQFPPQLSQAEKTFLMEIARNSIEKNLKKNSKWTPPINELTESLKKPGASFVTLYQNGELRGCIGSLRAKAPLAMDVAENAYAAANLDSRFEKIKSMKNLVIEISVLSEPVRLSYKDEEDMLNQLKPGIDGVIIHTPSHHATFLPSVWSSLPDKKEFISRLKKKAGLERDYWSNDIEVSVYHTEKIFENAES